MEIFILHSPLLRVSHAALFKAAYWLRCDQYAGGGDEQSRPLGKSAGWVMQVWGRG